MERDRLERDRRIAVIVGAKRTGKTTLARHLVDRYPGHVIVVDPADEWGELGVWPVPWGVRRRDALLRWLGELTAEGRGAWEGLLVLDDWDRYVAAVPGESWTDLLVANRHLGIDVLAIGHRPQALPKEALANADLLWIFATRERRARDALRDIPGLEDLEDAEIPTATGEALAVDMLVGSRVRVTVPFSAQD